MPWLGDWLETLRASGIPVAAWLLAAARILPTALLVPAFGLLALAVPMRVIWAFALSAATFPAASWVAPHAAQQALDTAFAAQLLREMLLGLPVGVSAAVLVWGSLMVGGIVDQLQGLRLRYGLGEAGAGAFASLFSLAAAYAFLRFDGVPFVVERLFPLTAAATDWTDLLTRASSQLVASVGLAVAIAAPLLVSSVVIDLALMSVSRAAGAMGSIGNLAALRSLLGLVVLYLLLPRVGQALALAFDFGVR